MPRWRRAVPAPAPEVPAAAADPRRLPSLELHIPGSPNEQFLTMTRCFVASLRNRGGPYADTRVVLTLGDEQRDEAIAQRLPWLADAGVEVRWVDAGRFQRFGLLANAADRFTYDFTSDIVGIVDADLLVARPFDDLIRRAHQAQCFVGRIGETSPFLGEERPDPWGALFDHLGAGWVPYEHEHPGFGRTFHDENLRFCPPYFNLGVLFAPAHVMAKLGRVVYEILERIQTFEFSRPYFALQLAVGCAVALHHIPYLAMPMRYNFLNHRNIDQWCPDELDDVRIVHVTRKVRGDVDKRELFSSPEAIESFVNARDVVAVNVVIQDVLREVLPDLKREPSLI
jgi:hypothetical protein